jgi:hypothetical protein
MPVKKRNSTMREFRCDKNVEISGEVILACSQGFPENQRPFLEECFSNAGLMLDTTEAGRFYCYLYYLSALKDIRYRFGDIIVEKIAYNCMQHINFPPEWSHFLTSLENLDTGYKLHVRGGRAGQYTYEAVRHSSMSQLKMRDDTPLPCEYTRGVLEGLSKRYPPMGGGQAVIRHDEGSPCKKKGGDSCTYVVSWI